MRGRIMLLINDVKLHPYKPGYIMVQVKIPRKNCNVPLPQWVEPDMFYIRRMCRTPKQTNDTDTERMWRKILKGKRVPIPELEDMARREGDRITRKALAKVKRRL